MLLAGRGAVLKPHSPWSRGSMVNFRAYGLSREKLRALPAVPWPGFPYFRLIHLLFIVFKRLPEVDFADPVRSDKHY